MNTAHICLGQIAISNCRDVVSAMVFAFVFVSLFPMHLIILTIADIVDGTTNKVL